MTRFDEDNKIWEKTCDDLGIIDEARIIEELQIQISKQDEVINNSDLEKGKQVKIREALLKEKEDLLAKLTSAQDKIEEYQNPILYVEDKYSQIYKIAYLKLNDIECDVHNFEKLFKDNARFIIYSKECANELSKFLDLVNIEDQEGKNILGLFDFDSAYSEFNGLKSSRWSELKGYEKSGIYRERNAKFKAMVLPVPEFRKYYASKVLGENSSLEIELLFANSILKKLGNLKEVPVSGSHEKIKKFAGKKSSFWKKLFDLEKNDFKNFKPLFDKIENLFGEDND